MPHELPSEEGLNFDVVLGDGLREVLPRARCHFAYISGRRTIILAGGVEASVLEIRYEPSEDKDYIIRLVDAERKRMADYLSVEEMRVLLYPRVEELVPESYYTDLLGDEGYVHHQKDRKLRF